jgi:putative ABC transport system permease protein
MRGPSVPRLIRSQCAFSWRQLSSEKMRFVAALAGVTFGVVLMMFQLGLYWAIMDMVARPLKGLDGELVIISKNYEYFGSNSPFTRRRLLQAQALPEVADVAPLYTAFTRWRNPVDGQYKQLFALGIDKSDNPFLFPEVVEGIGKLSSAEDVLYDGLSSREFGPVAEMFARDGVVASEIENQRVQVRGVFSMGKTLAASGHVLMGMDAFHRLLQHRPHSMINVGNVRLRPGADPLAVRIKLEDYLDDDVQVLTKEAFVHFEQVYWRDRTPVGFVTVAAMLVGMMVGGVIVYQILYTDINDHLHEYATLKAIGWQDKYFFVMIMIQSLILLAIGFVPGTIITMGLNYLARTIACIPAYATPTGTAIVFLLSMLMCMGAASLAVRRLRTADPADLF